MTKGTRKIIGIVLMLAFAAWIILSVIPMGGGESSNKRSATPAKNYEPHFRQGRGVGFL
ncbi:MAG: hypothetical protein U5L96_12205 [Owenweeksia sp.]|nr:hypothetical protein [Owenweeksia sp.]